MYKDKTRRIRIIKEELQYRLEKYGKIEMYKDKIGQIRKARKRRDGIL